MSDDDDASSGVLHRRISVRMWGDEKFRALSAPPPNAQTLWVYLLTGEHTGRIPGVFRAGEASLAEALGWSLKAFRRCFQELESRHMATADWTRRLVFLRNAVRHNLPQSPNVVLGWHREFRNLPDCLLRDEARAHVAEQIRRYCRSEYLVAFETPIDSRERDTIPRWVRAAVLRRDGSLCRLCGEMIADGSARHLDHRRPWSKGGDSTVENLQVAHARCNLRKGARWQDGDEARR